VVSAINNYRTSSGLAALTGNNLLTTLAQAQADYQAQLGTVTHTGPGGTTPQQRAANAGYGGGSFFYLSEIIYGGYQATTADALNWWQNSSLHNSVMLSGNYTEIGAGVATNGTTVYFTAVLGGPTGGSSGSGSVVPTPGSQAQPTQGAVIAVPVQVATPGPDGAVIHIVRTGQTLWTIAAVYNIPLDTLLTLNGLTTSSYVFPGDELLIQPAGTEPLAEERDAQSPDPDFSPSPDASDAGVIGEPYSAVLAPEILPTSTAQATPPPIEITDSEAANLDDQTGSSSALYLIIAAVAVILLTVTVNILLHSPPESTGPSD
jgi:LysM repeat protein